MNVKEIRDKKDDDLKKTLEEFKSELFDLRFQKATGSVDNPMRIMDCTIDNIQAFLDGKPQNVVNG